MHIVPTSTTLKISVFEQGGMATSTVEENKQIAINYKSIGKGVERSSYVQVRVGGTTEVLGLP